MKPRVGFERELVGTWQVGFLGDSDTLILRDDHTYRQTIHRSGAGYYGAVNYQSDWQPWWIQYRSNGIPYLHLEGMRLCGIERERSCTKPSGSGYDFCSEKYVPMENEGILLILWRSPTTDPPSPKQLSLIFPQGDEGSQLYTHVKP